jgi:acetoin utilization deacetylase AcuC-like enzyme
MMHVCRQIYNLILYRKWVGLFFVEEFLVSPLATFEELATTHSEDYIERFLKGDQTELEQRNVGFPWSEQGVKRASSSVGGTMAAACHVCELWKLLQQQQNTRLPVAAPWGAHIAGGTHHAFYDYGEGFSVFSDIAVAANVVLQRYPDLIKKILIVDLDVHQGNGNAVLFQGRPEVVTFSIQCEANYFSQKQESDLDIELPVDCNDQTYLATLNHWLNRIAKERGDDFDMIFFQAGVDILEDDRLGRMSLSQKGVERRNQLVYEFAHKLNIPLVICMGGGYPRGEDWTPIIEAHANVYCQAHSFLTSKNETNK